MLSDIINWPLAEQLLVMIIAALPVFELRGAIPIAVDVFGLSWYHSLFLSVVGNLLPVPFLLLFYDTLSGMVSRTKTGKRIMDWLYTRTSRQTRNIEKYKRIGLIIFVAIPLPGTGAWTASIAAHLLRMKFGNALLDIALGVIGAGVIVTALVLLGWIGAGIALTGLILIAVVSFWRYNSSKR
jgi:uncharacterized membrane protein